MIPDYPNFADITFEMRQQLHPLFKLLPDGISEFAFANIYLFRDVHKYKISRITDRLFVICGSDSGKTFFMLPFGIPEQNILSELFQKFVSIKNCSQTQADVLAKIGYEVTEDRDNFDYLYSREELANLSGRKFHKKKNLLNSFLKNNKCDAKPLLDEYMPDAMDILERWKNQQPVLGDYTASKEALEKMEQLQLCGGIFYINDKPTAYCLGEELALGTTYAIHFEKAIIKDEFKGIYQYVNQFFASILPDKYQTINREQDLGDEGLRQAKMSYNPIGFIKKYRIAMI